MVPFEYPDAVMGSRRHPESEWIFVIHGSAVVKENARAAYSAARSTGLHILHQAYVPETRQHAANLRPRRLQAFLQLLQAFLQLKVRREAASLGIILVMVHLSLFAVCGA